NSTRTVHRNVKLVMLWTAPPPARERQGCGCCLRPHDSEAAVPPQQPNPGSSDSPERPKAAAFQEIIDRHPNCLACMPPNARCSRERSVCRCGHSPKIVDADCYASSICSSQIT